MGNPTLDIILLKALLLGSTTAGSLQLNPATVIPKQYKICRPGSHKHNGTISRLGGGATFCPTSLRYAYRGKHRLVYLHLIMNVVSLFLSLFLTFELLFFFTSNSNTYTKTHLLFVARRLRPSVLDDIVVKCQYAMQSCRSV